MRFVFISGGLTGFLLAAGASYSADSSAGRVFLDGALGCLAGAVLFRWLWTVLLGGLRETLVTRHEAALAAESAKPKP
jgi:hypothetical protein